MTGAEAVPLRFFGGLIIELEPVYWPSSRRSVEPGFANGQKLAILNGCAAEEPLPVPLGEA